MAQKRKNKALLDEVLDARARFLSKRKRLEWAVEFAQDKLDTLRPGRWADLRLELTAFPNVGPMHPKIRGKTYVDLFSDDEIRYAHEGFRRGIATLVMEGKVTIGRYNAEVTVGVYDWGVLKGKPYLDVDIGIIDLGGAERAIYTLGLLLGDYANLVKECPAPKPRGGSKGEKCGRWFVGRPNQTYCSPLCQNRASTQTSRRTIPYSGQRIRATSYLSPPQGWVAEALIFSPTREGFNEQEVMSPQGEFFETREKADLHAYDLAKKWIDSPANAIKAKRRKGAMSKTR